MVWAWHLCPFFYILFPSHYVALEGDLGLVQLHCSLLVDIGHFISQSPVLEHFGTSGDSWSHPYDLIYLTLMRPQWLWEKRTSVWVVSSLTRTPPWCLGSTTMIRSHLITDYCSYAGICHEDLVGDVGSWPKAELACSWGPWSWEQHITYQTCPEVQQPLMKGPVHRWMVNSMKIELILLNLYFLSLGTFPTFLCL